jgi:hypothetical protein
LLLLLKACLAVLADGSSKEIFSVVEMPWRAAANASAKRLKAQLTQVVRREKICRLGFR